MKKSLIYDATASKRSINLSLNSDLLTKARRYKLNLSKKLENALLDALTEKEHSKWLEENRDALETYNERVETRGIFGDGLRTF